MGGHDLKHPGAARSGGRLPMANQVGNRAAGVPHLPDPKTFPEVVKNEQIVGEDDTVDAAFLAEGSRALQSVARIKVPRFQNEAPVQSATGGPWVMLGTAWVIGQRLVVTNRH